MKRIVRKIDIKEEFLAVNCVSDQLIFRKMSDPSDYSQLNLPVQLEEQHYYITKYVDTNEEPIYYAIQDKELFEKILNLAEDKLNAIKNNRFNDGIESGFREGRDVGIFEGENRKTKEIKSLSWWKRLLKRF